MAGKLRWELTGGKIIHAVKDDVVWIPRGTVHHIVTEGDEMSLRFAISLPPAEHIWMDDCDNCDVIWDPRPASCLERGRPAVPISPRRWSGGGG